MSPRVSVILTDEEAEDVRRKADKAGLSDNNYFRVGRGLPVRSAGGARPRTDLGYQKAGEAKEKKK